MNNLKKAFVFSSAILFSQTWNNSGYSKWLNLQIDIYKTSVEKALSKEFQIKDFEKILDEKLQEINLTQEQKQEIKEIFSKESFKKELFEILKQDFSWSIENIILSLILWFLYWYAYFWTIKKVRKNAMPIVIWSFVTFSLTSWWMVLINWFVPWSLVYFESFLLALYVVFLHLKNQKEWKLQKFENFSEFIEENPLPVVRYNKNWKPILWNKKMEEETWYSYDEVLLYYEKNQEIMTLLYKWENLQKVKKYLKQIEKTWIWYKNIAFTMTTKYWEEKTFLWTTLPDWQGWTIRIARYLTDKEEKCLL